MSQHKSIPRITKISLFIHVGLLTINLSNFNDRLLYLIRCVHVCLCALPLRIYSLLGFPGPGDSIARYNWCLQYWWESQLLCPLHGATSKQTIEIKNRSSKWRTTRNNIKLTTITFWHFDTSMWMHKQTEPRNGRLGTLLSDWNRCWSDYSRSTIVRIVCSDRCVVDDCRDYLRSQCGFKCEHTVGMTRNRLEGGINGG